VEATALLLGTAGAAGCAWGEVLAAWARVAALFTQDAIFQGLHPYGVGRQDVADYYASQPLGMEAAYRILETRRYGDDLVLGYLAVEFTFTDRAPLNVKLAVLVTRTGNDWYIGHYQVSHLD
jgi:hypothetical protein